MEFWLVLEENAGATSVSGVSIALLAIEAEFLGLSGDGTWKYAHFKDEILPGCQLTLSTQTQLGVSRASRASIRVLSPRPTPKNPRA